MTEPISIHACLIATRKELAQIRKLDLRHFWQMLNQQRRELRWPYRGASIIERCTVS